MRYRISHLTNTDIDTFWDKLFFDEAYNEALYSGHLRFSTYNVQKLEKQADGTVVKRVEAAPPIELPGTIKKVLGDFSSYIEDGVYNPKTRRYVVNVTPSTAADKVKTRVEVWCEPKGDKQCERIAEIDNEVKIFGVGKVVEKFIEQQMRDTYDKAAEFTNRWIAEKGL